MRGSVRGVEQAFAAWQQRPTDAHVVLLTDFDGTLADFQVNPALVRLAEPRQILLRSIAEHPDFTFGVVSGRRIADLRERVPVGPAAYYAGLHGLEIEGPGLRFVHQLVSVASPTLGVLQREIVDA